MTREEAIKLIEEFMVIDDWSLVYLPDLHDALELAREALQENESLARSVNEASELLRKKRPRGEWVKDFNMDKGTVCSECGEEAWYKEYCGWVTESNFCPNCGADMRKRDGDRNEID